MADAAGSPPRRATDDTPREFNPRWKGYVYVLISSLVNFSSISGLEIDDNPEFDGVFQFSLVFGIVTFALSVIILAMDRFQYCCDSSKNFNYTKAMDGKIEGYTLLAFTLWWIVGVSYITQVGGVGYVANNIYFSSWLSLFSCVYTLDKWSAAKDILSIQELTGVSATLKSWYVLFLSSLVTMGTSCDLHIQLAETYQSSAAYGVALGLGSTLVASFFILVHYRIIDYQFLHVGGWIELSASFFMILLWIIGVAVLTSEGGIAATIGGSGCASRIDKKYDIDWNKECYVVWIPGGVQEDEETDTSRSTPVPEQESGTNATTAPLPTAEPSDSPSAMTSAPSNGPLPSVNEPESPFDTSTGSTTTGSPLPSANATGNATDPLDTFVPTIDSTMDPSESASFSLAPSSLITAEDDEETDPPFMDLDIVMIEDDIPNEATEIPGNTTSNATLTDEAQNNNTRFLQELDDLQSTFNDTAINATANATTTTNATNNGTTIGNETTNATTQPSPLPSPKPTYRPVITSSSTQFPTYDSPTQFPTYYPYHQRITCGDVLNQQIPGSNLYLACWVCFFASFNVTLRWKAAQAIQFAQAQNRKADQRSRRLDVEKEDDDADDDERDPGNAYPVDDDDLH